MKQFKSIAFKLVLPGLLYSVITYGQKLSNVQQAGLRAPDAVKIDGKAAGWDNTFQAYNKATNVFYTMVNDDDNVYIVIQARDRQVIEKIMAGGITFNVKKADKKSGDNALMLTYPILSRNFQVALQRKWDNKFQAIDGDATANAADESATLNKQLADNAREIKVSGIKDVTDTLVSIYNEHGIKATAFFDAKGFFTYKLVVPLKYFMQTMSNDTFSYLITLNGFKTNAVHIHSTQAAVQYQDLTSPTDFSGIYALAKN